MRALRIAVLCSALVAAGCSGSTPADSGSSTGSTDGTGSGSTGSGTTGTPGGASGSSSGTTGIQAGGSCSQEGASVCADFHHQATCQGGTWTLRDCDGPTGCQGSTCDRHDATPGSPCDARDTEPACDFNYNQLHCDLASGTWAETCYCGTHACDDATGTCPSGCFDGGAAGSTTTGGATSTTGGATTSTGTGGTTSAGSTTGTTGGATTGTSGTTGSVDGGLGGTARLDPVGFTSHAAFGYFPRSSDGGVDRSQALIFAFDAPISCQQAQNQADGGIHALYVRLNNQGSPVVPNGYPVSLLGPAVVAYAFPGDGGMDAVVGTSGTVQLTRASVDSGFAGSLVFWGQPQHGSPSPSPDGGYSGSFDATYCQF